MYGVFCSGCISNVLLFCITKLLLTDFCKKFLSQAGNFGLMVLGKHHTSWLLDVLSWAELS